MEGKGVLACHLFIGLVIILCLVIGECPLLPVGMIQVQHFLFPLLGPILGPTTYLQKSFAFIEVIYLIKLKTEVAISKVPFCMANT